MQQLLRPYTLATRARINHLLQPASIKALRPGPSEQPVANTKFTWQVMASDSSTSAWRGLEVPGSELTLAFCLTTGQSFRWRELPEGAGWVGVIGRRVVHMQQDGAGTRYRVLARGAGCWEGGDEAALADYFNLGVRLAELAPRWLQDPHFRSLYQAFQGARVLRQDPLECLVEFICSSNNHISRIQGMVDRLCAVYGTLLYKGQEGTFHAFPDLEQLAAASEADLRAAGFGYRGKFIAKTVEQLRGQPDGLEWLLSLRQASYEDAVTALTTLCGVGPKVAGCVALFSLDKHQSVPVDTHIWQVACAHYTPHLKGKTLTKAIMLQVEAALQDIFGPYAGWAQNYLFNDRLAQKLAQKQGLVHRHLPLEVETPTAMSGEHPSMGALRDVCVYGVASPETPDAVIGSKRRAALREELSGTLGSDMERAQRGSDIRKGRRQKGQTGRSTVK